MVVVFLDVRLRWVFMEYLRDGGEFMCEKERKNDSFCLWMGEWRNERVTENDWKKMEGKKKLKENRSFKSVVYPCLAKWRVFLECEVWMKKRWERFLC